MGDETSALINLDLNLGPGPDPVSGSDDPVVEPPVGRGRVRDAFRPISRRHRWRWRPLDPRETENIAMERIRLRTNSGNAVMSRSQTGEGSSTPIEQTVHESTKKEFENKTIDEVEDEMLKKKGEEKKNHGNAGTSFFDCNICMDLSKDPVVTCCGHLFCWSCLYQWLHLHSDTKECPVCKGHVTFKNVTPIYGCGGSVTRESENDDSNLRIPLRPEAHRVKSLRQSFHRNAAFTFPMEEVLQRLGHRFDLTGDLSRSQGPETGIRRSQRMNSILDRIMTSGAMRGEQNLPVSSEDLVDLMPTTIRRSRRISSFMSSLVQLQDDFPSLRHPIERNQEQPLVPHVEDRDSYSSVAAVMNSESENAVEIDSIVSLSTLSSSRRRNDTSRVSDVVSGDSRASRRRRFS